MKILKLIIITIIQLLGFEDNHQPKYSLYPNPTKKKFHLPPITKIILFLIGIIIFTIIIFLITGTSTVESGSYYYGINNII
jgi:hypothetical protein